MFELPTFSGDVVVAAQMYWRKNKNGGPGIQSVSLRHQPPTQPHHHETVIAPSPLIFFFFFIFEYLLVYKYHLKYDKVQKCVESSFGNQIRLILSICLRIGQLGHNLTWKRKRKYFHYIIGDGLYPLFLGHHGTENDWLVYFVYLEKQTQLIFYYLKLILDIFWQQ